MWTKWLVVGVYGLAYGFCLGGVGVSGSCQDLRNDVPWNAAEVIPSTELLRSAAEKCQIGFRVYIHQKPKTSPTTYYQARSNISLGEHELEGPAAGCPG